MYYEITDWYEKNKRDLPFRYYSEPYPVWVSEIMAQQTKIETMIPYFLNWMDLFPTIESCASAPLTSILKAWEGLGYYRRARFLHLGCKYIVENHNGVFPSEYRDIIKIPGIGEYTASAISSIVYNQKRAAVDGNVLRVVSRVIEYDQSIDTATARQHVSKVVTEWMSESHLCDCSSFTQGLMEIGALVCLPANPLCDECPLKMKCGAYKNDTWTGYPIRKKSNRVPSYDYDVFLVIKENRLLVSEDWSDGLMLGLLRLPQHPINNAHPFVDAEYKGTASHIYSHKKWRMNVFVAALKEETFIPQHTKWVSFDSVYEYPWITAHKKIIQTYLQIKG